MSTRPSSGKQTNKSKDKRSTAEHRHSEDHEQRNLDDAVAYFTNEDSSTKVRNNLPLSLSLETIENQAKDNGLGTEHIEALVEVAASSRFPDSVSIRLIKSLIPNDKVTAESFLTAVSWMCTNKPSSNVQSMLIRWMIIIYDLVEEQQKVQTLYGMIFFFTENETMCPHVCQLLYLMTRKEDVRMFRIRHLLNLQLKMGIQPHITALLGLYKMYCPSLVTIVIPRSQRVLFKRTQLDRVWSENIHRVQEQNMARRREREDVSNLSMSRLRDADASILEPRTKRRKVDPIPELYTANVTSTQLDTSVSAVDTSLDIHRPVPFEQIKTMKDLCHNICRLQMPGQMGSSLRSKLLLYYMSCTSNPVTAARFSYWLSSVLSEEILHSPYSKRGEEILEALANFTDFLQESVPVCETFLTKYLHLWDGTSYRIYILVLITRFRLYPFSTLNDLLLEPLRKLFFCSNVYFKCQLLICLRKLLQNFITVELERYNTTLRRQENVLENETESFNHVSLFVEEVEKFQPLQTVAEFIDFVDAMCLVGLGLERDNALMMSCVLDFFELVSSLTVQYGTPFVLLPSRGLIYKGLFANNGMTCSRMCGILLNCRNGFLKLKSMPKPDNLGLVNIDVNSIDTLNACVLDFCDSLWRYRAFKKDTRYPTAFTVEDGVVEALSVPRVNECFSLHRHQAFLGFAWAYLKEFQPPEKKVHPDQIKQAKRSYLEFLRREQLHGIAEFIEQFIKKASSSMSESHIAASMASP